MSERLVITQGDDGPILESLWRGVPHNRSLCPHCGDRIDRIPIHRLVYSFEDCACEDVGYKHLVERLWHPACYLLAKIAEAGKIGAALEAAIKEAKAYREDTDATD